MKKISTVAMRGNEIFRELKLTVGLDLGDRASHYCILDEAGKVILEHDLPTTPKGVQQIDVLAGYPNCEVPLNAIYSCLDAAYLTLLLPLQHFLRFSKRLLAHIDLDAGDGRGCIGVKFCDVF